ncbi:response regulator transcription factor, partial [Pandoraea pneumonica]|uniref:response regulator transcription factor n=2 Tax=Bacteria TaxID=2 RepID=UPI003CECAE3A
LELAARIRSVLRRTSRNTSPVRPAALELGPYLLEVKTQRLYKSGRLVKLTAREFQLMKFFLQKRNEPVTRDELLDEVWGLNYFGDPKTVDVH